MKFDIQGWTGNLIRHKHKAARQRTQTHAHPTQVRGVWKNMIAASRFACVCVYFYIVPEFSLTRKTSLPSPLARRTFLYTQQLILVFIMDSVIKHRRWDRCARCEFKFYSFDWDCHQRHVYEKKRGWHHTNALSYLTLNNSVICLCQHQHAKKKNREVKLKTDKSFRAK